MRHVMVYTPSYKDILPVYTLICGELTAIILLKSDVLVLGLSELGLFLEIRYRSKPSP